jgi:2-polyprenyl-3-methyl-5-hydroxy-6-metoxy-1,4-benzoquinol methylase
MSAIIKRMMKNFVRPLYQAYAVREKAIIREVIMEQFHGVSNSFTSDLPLSRPLDIDFEKKLYDRFPFLETESWDGLDASAGGFKSHYRLLNYFPDDFKSICDLGCGHGYDSLYFKIKGHTVTSIDINDSCKFKNELDYRKVSLENINLTFDAIFLSHVIEHILTPVDFFHTIKEHLNPGGYLFVLVPCTTFVQTGHWWKGFCCGQLAVFLASFGFDCRESTFISEGYNLLGYGRKSDRKENLGFSVDEALPYLPKRFMDVAKEEASGCHSLECNNVRLINHESLYMKI